MVTRIQVDGATQIQSGTVPWSAMSSGAIVPLSSIINNGQIILSTGTVSMGASLGMGGYTITSVGNPVNTTDAATKQYVDLKMGGIGGLHDVRILAASNVTTSGLSSIDGVTPISGDLILSIAQSTGSQNGPWVAASGVWTRPTWWASATVVNEGQYFMVAEGTTYKDTKFFCTTTGTITVDATSISFTQDQSGISYTAGASGGLSLGGNAFVINTGNGIAISANNVIAVGTGLVSVGASGIQIVNSSSNGQLVVGNASNIATWTTMSGDAALGASGALTLTTVNSNIGSYGSATAIPSLTINGKGLITAASVNTVIAPAGTLTGTVLNSTVVGSSLTSVGTLSSLSVSGATTFTLAPVMTALTGFLYGNGASAVSASATIPSTALRMSVNEVPTGILNGTNTIFTLASSPVVSSLILYMNGLILRPGSSFDYTVSGGIITMNYAPLAVDVLICSYFY